MFSRNESQDACIRPGKRHHCGRVPGILWIAKDVIIMFCDNRRLPHSRALEIADFQYFYYFNSLGHEIIKVIKIAQARFTGFQIIEIIETIKIIEKIEIG